jgi:hydroxymethylpyrimidine pyrophosphatase-like HAD family hydrolase
MVMDRLIEEVKEHGSLIIAVDFDNTIYDFHSKGFKFPRVVAVLKEAVEKGHRVVVFTANENHSMIKEHCKSLGLTIEGINTNILPQFTGSKIYYNLLLDDRAGLYEALNYLEYLLEKE